MSDRLKVLLYIAMLQKVIINSGEGTLILLKKIPVLQQRSQEE